MIVLPVIILYNMIVLPGIILLRCVSAVVGVACLAVLQDTTKQSGGQYSTQHSTPGQIYYTALLWYQATY